jgi:RHS repeat-associated protein
VLFLSFEHSPVFLTLAECPFFRDRVSDNIIQQSNYTYDVNNLRIGKSVDSDGTGAAPANIERFVYGMNNNIALEFDGSGTQTSRYLYSLGIDQFLADEQQVEGRVLWALTDHIGTVRDLIDSTGTQQNHITYDSFGGITSQTDASVTTRFGYTGRELNPEIGLHYYRARYYDSNNGRFINEDPLRLISGDSNLYRYVFNAPITSTDPLGLFRIELRFRGFFSGFENVGRRSGTYETGFDIGFGRFHADIIVNDIKGTRAYWAGPEKKVFEELPEGLFRSAGIIKADANLDYGPGDQYYIGDPTLVQVVYVDGKNCPDPRREAMIVQLFQKVQAARTPYNVFGPNSNSAASFVLFNVLGKFIHPQKFTPGWYMSPISGDKLNRQGVPKPKPAIETIDNFYNHKPPSL